MTVTSRIALVDKPYTCPKEISGYIDSPVAGRIREFRQTTNSFCSDYGTRVSAEAVAAAEQLYSNPRTKHNCRPSYNLGSSSADEIARADYVMTGTYPCNQDPELNKAGDAAAMTLVNVGIFTKGAEQVGLTGTFVDLYQGPGDPGKGAALFAKPHVQLEVQANAKLVCLLGKGLTIFSGDIGHPAALEAINERAEAMDADVKKVISEEGVHYFLCCRADRVGPKTGTNYKGKMIKEFLLWPHPVNLTLGGHNSEVGNKLTFTYATLQDKLIVNYGAALGKSEEELRRAIDFLPSAVIAAIQANSIYFQARVWSRKWIFEAITLRVWRRDMGDFGDDVGEFIMLHEYVVAYMRQLMGIDTPAQITRECVQLQPLLLLLLLVLLRPCILSRVPPFLLLLSLSAQQLL